MNNMIIGVCDDVDGVHSIVEDLIKEYVENRDIDIELVNFKSAMEVLESKADMKMLLLDIEMPQMDGIELGRRLKQQGADYKIIMLSGMFERFKEAFEIEAYRFVTKPIDKDELFRAIDDVAKNLIMYKEVQVHRDGISINILQKDIIYIESNRCCTYVYTLNQEYRSDETLNSWMDILDNRHFYRCHKSYIVNLAQIADINARTLILSNENKVVVARREFKAFMQSYINFDLYWR